MGLHDMLGAERAAVEAYEQSESRKYRGRKVTVLGNVDATPYIGYRVPGLTGVGALSDPAKMLKDPVKGALYLWRKPDDGYTRWMVESEIAKPVTENRIDKASSYATTSFAKIITREGRMSVVRTPAGLGLFEVVNPERLTDEQKAHLPGDWWEHQYLGELAGVGDTFEGDLEDLGRRYGGRARPGDLQTRKHALNVEDSQRGEMAFEQNV